MNAVIEALNQTAAGWWTYVAHATWQSSMLAGIILLVVWLGRRWPAQLRYALALIALLKFTIPPTLSLPTGLFSWLGPTVVLPGAAAEAAAGLAATGSVPAGAGAWLAALSAISWQAWLMLAHGLGAAGALGFVAWQFVQVHRLGRRAKLFTHGPVCEQIGRLAQKIGLRRPVRLFVSAEAVSPMAFGVLRPSVLVPASLFRQIPPEQMRTILIHELAHHRRGDILVNWCQALLAAAWWFNPVFWVLNRTVRKTREDCCDDLLLARRLTTDGAYCEALLKVAGELSRRLLIGAASGFAQRFHPLGDRMRRIMDRGLRRAPKLSTVGMALAVLVAGLVLPGLRTGQAPRPAGPPEDALAAADGEPEPFRPARWADTRPIAGQPPMHVGWVPGSFGPLARPLGPAADGPHDGGSVPFEPIHWDADEQPGQLAGGRLGKLLNPLEPTTGAGGLWQGPSRADGRLLDVYADAASPAMLKLADEALLSIDEMLDDPDPETAEADPFEPLKLRTEPPDGPKAPPERLKQDNNAQEIRFAQNQPKPTRGSPRAIVSVELPPTGSRCTTVEPGPSEPGWLAFGPSEPEMPGSQLGYDDEPDVAVIAIADAAALPADEPDDDATAADDDGWGDWGFGSWDDWSGGVFVVGADDYAPEPVTLVTLAVGALALLRRRRRRP